MKEIINLSIVMFIEINKGDVFIKSNFNFEIG